MGEERKRGRPRKFNERIIVTQEGGYDLEKVPTAIDNFLTSLIEKK